MIFPVCVYGHPVLRKLAKEIDEDYKDLDQFIKDMFETMYISDGIGLASPQVGKSIRLFIIDASPLEDEDPAFSDFKKVFINPQIIEKNGDKSNFNEGCLSIPNLREEVAREPEIRIRYYDEDFNFYDEVYSGTISRVIQHEYDHLEGILFTDRVSPIRKRLLKGKLTGISKGRFEASYKTILPNNKLVFPAK
ncbi:MAG: peptide deformylase [Bacteroidetes bacterium]|nr:MAG: peptide deformylase [Bacteroidota bacterium]